MTWPVQRQRHRHLEKHIQRAIQETCSMWWGDKTWQTKKVWGKMLYTLHSDGHDGANVQSWGDLQIYNFQEKDKKNTIQCN